MFFFIVAFAMEMSFYTKEFWKSLSVFSSFGLSYLLYCYFCSFMFRSVDKALKLFAVINFFIVFCIPFMIISILYYWYLETLSVTTQSNLT